MTVIARSWAMPNAETFSVPVIGDLVKRQLRGVSVDPFARNKRWATYTNDLNPNTEAEYHMDAPAFLWMLAERGVKADCVIFDPPYSPRQISECYAAAGLKCGMAETQSASFKKKCRDAIRALSKKGTVVLSFGWNSVGMGEGYSLDEILIVCHGGDHNDTICLVETMQEEQTQLFSEAA